VNELPIYDAAKARRMEGVPPMPPIPALAIVNPVASGGGSAALWRRLEASVQRRFPDLTIQSTRGPGDGEVLAREWAGRRPGGMVLVIGGDGTIHEVVNGLVATGQEPRLAVIPSGTGNDFARNTAIPLDPDAAVARLGEHSARRVDLGRIRFCRTSGAEETRVFLNSVSIGVSPRANRIAHTLRRALPGKLCYALGGIAALVSEGRRRFRVSSGDSVTWDGEALNLTVANCASFGGGMRISPGSCPTDGILEQVVIGRLGRLRALLALSRLYAGTHVSMRGVSVTPVRVAARIRAGEGPLLIEADGHEFFSDGELIVEPLPGALTLFN
jgi:diacylglycerol kinase (ATP)